MAEDGMPIDANHRPARADGERRIEPVSACPNEDTIIRFADEGLPPSASQDVSRHVSQCPECRELVVGLIKLKRAPDLSVSQQMKLDRADAGLDEGSPGLPVGTRVGRYLVLEEVGHGGMGRVYVAYDPTLDRKVALKLVHAGWFSASPEVLRARLLLEAQAMAKLSHPNVCVVFDVQPIGDEVSIAMEYVEGATLADWLKQERRSWRDIIAVFLQAAEGLNAAHKAGLVHRDFKPDNVLIHRSGRAVVTDFGLVRILSESTVPGDEPKPDNGPGDGATQLVRPMTRTGALMGTPVYMAPEQLLGHAADERTDQYSFCVALYEALYGGRPISADTLAELRDKAVSAGVSPPKSSDVPAWIRNVVMRGLSKAPADRYESMEDLIRALRSDPARKRRRIAAVGLAIVLVAVTAAALGSAWRQRGGSCDASSRPLDGVWDDAMKAKIRGQFLASSVAHAPDLFERAARELDRYASQLSASVRANCESARYGASAPIPALAAQSICLNNAKLAVSSLTRYLSRDIDADTIENAVIAVHGLPQLTLCSDLASLEARARMTSAASPRSPEAAAVETLLRDAEVLHNLGRPTEALAKAQASLALCQDPKLRAMTGDALYAVGRSQEVLGRYDDAHRVLVAAADHAAVVGNVPTYIRATLLAAEIVATRWAKPDEPHRRLSAIHEELVALAHDKLLLADFLHTRGYIAVQDGDVAGGLPQLQRAMDLYVEALGTWDHFALTRILQALTSAFSDAGRDAEAMAAGEKALAIANRALGPNSLWAGVLSCGQSVLYVWNAEPDKAHEYAARGLEIEAGAVGADNWRLGGCLSSLGQVELYYKNRPREAEGYFRRAYAIETKTARGGSDTLRAMAGLGESLLALNRPAEALEVFVQAERIASDLAHGRATADNAHVRVRADLARTRCILGIDRENARAMLAQASRDYAKWANSTPLDHRLYLRMSDWLNDCESLVSTRLRAQN